MKSRTNKDRRHTLRRHENRRDSDNFGDADFLCDDFDTPSVEMRARASSLRLRINYGLIVGSAALLIALGIMIDRL